MIENFSYKKFFINFGIFVGFIVVTFVILIYSVRLSKKSWQKNLKVSIENVLDEKEANTWTVGNFIQINNSFSLSAACYEAQNRRTGEVSKVLILRVYTYYGPLPAVFLIDKDKEVQFVGYSSVHGRVALQLTNKLSDKRIEFWKKKILEILE